MRNYEKYKRLLSINQDIATLQARAISEFKAIFKLGANVHFSKNGSLQVGKIIKVIPEEQELKVKNLSTGAAYTIKLYQVLNAEEELGK